MTRGCLCGKPHTWVRSGAESDAHTWDYEMRTAIRLGITTVESELNDLIAFDIVGAAYDIPDPRLRKPFR